VPSSEIAFEGKTLRVIAQPDTLADHRTDQEITDESWRLLRNDPVIMPDEFSSIGVSSAGGVLTLTGNLRRSSTRGRAEAIAVEVAGVTELRSRLKDDLQLEIDIAAQLSQAGIQRTASIYSRSSLGHVTLFGRAPSPDVAGDARRIAEAVDGVVSVNSRIEVDSKASARVEPVAAR
jgi:osmotically-inducible protein OsmY